MNELNPLASLGMTMPSPEYLLGSIIFGIAGMIAYGYGKRKDRPQPKWIGVGLMVYPYAVSETWLLYAIGAVLCVALYFFRE